MLRAHTLFSHSGLLNFQRRSSSIVSVLCSAVGSMAEVLRGER